MGVGIVVVVVVKNIKMIFIERKLKVLFLPLISLLFFFRFFNLGFKSKKKHSNTCCGKRVEHVVSSSSIVVLLFIYPSTLSTVRFKRLISVKEAHFKMASLSFFWCLKPLEEVVIR